MKKFSQQGNSRAKRCRNWDIEQVENIYHLKSRGSVVLKSPKTPLLTSYINGSFDMIFSFLKYQVVKLTTVPFVEGSPFWPKYDALTLHHLKGPHTKKRPNKNPLVDRPFTKGVVIRTIIRKPRKPNSANRKCVLVKLSNGKEMQAYVPGE